METSSVIFDKILRKLAENYNKSYNLEDLTILVHPYVMFRKKLRDKSAERQNQANILDALILLNDMGYIFLNSDTDESFITIKGLIKINNKGFCN